MDALLFIQDKRRHLEKIETVSMLRMMHASKKDAERIMEKWAKHAEIELSFED